MSAPSWRQRVAVLAGRSAGEATRRLGRGGGTALPGLVAGWLAPNLVDGLAASLDAGVVTVTGTNGKTTTASLLAAIAAAHGWDAVGNRSGSNLERGIVTSFVESPGGPGGPPRLGVLEVDEAALPRLFPRLRPRVALFLNLFRDQLDRYGEIDSIRDGWQAMLAGEGAESGTVVINADDPSLAALGEAPGARVVRFGIADAAVALAATEHAADARFCVCGHAFDHDAIYLGHLGHWRCDRCGRRRVAPEVAATRIVIGDDTTALTLDIAGARGSVVLPLAGLAAAYNATAAAAAAHALGIPSETILSALAAARPVFGRQERFEIDGRAVRVLLAKNPTGLNETLRLVAAGDARPTVLAILNDGVQDGRDVSWIYDADLEWLAPRRPVVICSGARADDLALRFAIAGIEPLAVLPNLELAVERAVGVTPRGGRLDVVPTYTAMLAVRDLLARRAGGRPYWERG